MRDGVDHTERTFEPNSTSNRTPRPSTADTDDARLCWLVPVDEHAEERAALEFAKWLDRGNDQHGFDAVYVPTAGGVPVEAVARRAKVAACEAGADELVDRFVEPEALQLPTEALWERDPDSFTGVIIARRAAKDDDALVRLGGLTRHVALRASAAVAVVPHDLETEGMSAGPVILGVDPEHTPHQALRIADTIASSKATTVSLVHVPTRAPTKPTSDAHDEDDATVQAIRRWADDAARRAGLAGRGFGEGDQVAIARGEVGPALRAVARRRDACVIVVGTRQRNVLARALRPSVAIELSRFAERPVVMVPEGAQSVSEQAASGS